MRSGPAPPPGTRPRPPALDEAIRVLTSSDSHRGKPPGVTWTWPLTSDPGTWPTARLDQGNYPGPTAAVGSAGDLWFFTLADMMQTGWDVPTHWVEALAFRLTPLYTGWLKVAFEVLGSLPLIWTVPDYQEPAMAAYQPHYRLAFGGPLFTLEEWSCRLNITSSGALPDDTAADGMLPDLVTALRNWVSGEHAALSDSVSLSWVKFNKCDAQGHYVNPSNSRTFNLSPVVSGYGSALLPPQVAVVVSLRTAHARGKAHAGRMFTPALGASPATGYCTLGATIAQAATELLNAINAVVTPAGVSIISATGESNAVTKVAVGRIFDTMRTRRKSLAESPYTVGSDLT